MQFFFFFWKLTTLLSIALILHLAHILWGTFQLINSDTIFKSNGLC